ncbi:MAG: hypothetical protein JWO56_305, partial [Acidobacteria bacterium]|nr:hypothetical protein [Acidobacteriota bacterium]
AYRSVPFLRRLLRVGERELDRRPRQALALIDFAARWARGDDSAAHQLLGDIWKHRANALRHLGRYSEALDAAEIGETFFSSVPNAEFDVGQARYATAVVLIKMNRYAEALEVLGAAEAILAPFGDTLPLAKAAVLRAGILFQQGDVDEAEKRWCAAIPILEQLGDRVELARVRANLAECHRAAGRYDDALRDAAHAIAAYRALEMDAERIRAEWTVANIQLNCDEAETGMAGLEEAAEAFELLGMIGDAGFVKLDVAEEHLRRGEWRDAASVAKEVVSLFVRAGVTVASVEALTFLRTAVEHEAATLPLVHYVREYIAADDPARSFAPPQ